jgi:hypothetical protein
MRLQAPGKKLFGFSFCTHVLGPMRCKRRRTSLPPTITKRRALPHPPPTDPENHAHRPTGLMVALYMYGPTIGGMSDAMPGAYPQITQCRRIRQNMPCLTGSRGENRLKRNQLGYDRCSDGVKGGKVRIILPGARALAASIYLWMLIAFRSVVGRCNSEEPISC